MAGQRQKPADALVNQRGDRARTDLALRPQEAHEVVVPPAPAGITPLAQLTWESFWASPAARLVDRAAHMPALVRWIEAISEREFIRVNYLVPGKDELLSGSTGQPVLNPMYKRDADLLKTIEWVEERYAMTPLAQVRLGVSVQTQEIQRIAIEDRLVSPRRQAPTPAASPASGGAVVEGTYTVVPRNVDDE